MNQKNCILRMAMAKDVIKIISNASLPPEATRNAFGNWCLYCTYSTKSYYLMYLLMYLYHMKEPVFFTSINNLSRNIRNWKKQGCWPVYIVPSVVVGTSTLWYHGTCIVSFIITSRIVRGQSFTILILTKVPYIFKYLKITLVSALPNLLMID